MWAGYLSADLLIQHLDLFGPLVLTVFEQTLSGGVQQGLLHPQLPLHDCKPAGRRAATDTRFSQTYEGAKLFALTYFALCWVSFSSSSERSFLRCSSAFCSSACIRDNSGLNQRQHACDLFASNRQNG